MEIPIRRSARVVLLNPEGRVLLFRWVIPPRAADEVERTWWITPGGGINPGESTEDAALRELWEETGIRDVPLGPCLWTRTVLFRSGDRVVDVRETYFLARIEREVELTRDNFEAYEHIELTEHRWWSLAEMEACADEFVPPGIRQLLPALLANDLPSVPLILD